jgi:hypothetical protein
MMLVLQGYTNDGLLMNNFGPESDWRHKHKLLLSLFFTTHFSASIFYPLVFIISVSLIHFSWRRETWKMSLVILKRLSPCIGVWKKVDGS